MSCGRDNQWIEVGNNYPVLSAMMTSDNNADIRALLLCIHYSNWYLILQSKLSYVDVLYWLFSLVAFLHFLLTYSMISANMRLLCNLPFCPATKELLAFC